MAHLTIDKEVTGRYKSIARMLNTVAFYALLALLVWLPIPLGSNRPWSWGVMEVAVFSIFIVWLLSQMFHPRPLSSAVTKARIPLLLFSLWVLFSFLQAFPISSSLLQALNPAGYSLKEYALGSVLKEGSALSNDPGATLVAALKAATYLCLFFLVLVLIRSRTQLKTLALVLFLVGLFEAFYGMMAFFAPYLPFFWNPSPGSLSGTYINRNHFAGLMEMTIPIGIGFIFYRMRRPQIYINWQSQLRGMAQACLARRNLIVLSVIIMFGALFLSTSRGGALAMVTALLLVILFVRLSLGSESPEARLLPWVVLLIIAAISWFGITGLVDRLANQTLDTNRIAVWQSGYDIFKDYPIMGAGGGTFQWMNPLYRGGEIGKSYNEHAHNDYVEVLSESGIVGFMLLACALAFIIYNNLRFYLKRRDRFVRAMLFASTTAVTAQLLHACVDFNFQIPANMAYFFVLLAIGVKASTLKQRKKVFIPIKNR